MLFLSRRVRAGIIFVAWVLSAGGRMVPGNEKSDADFAYYLTPVTFPWGMKPFFLITQQSVPGLLFPLRYTLRFQTHNGWLHYLLRLTVLIKRCYYPKINLILNLLYLSPESRVVYLSVIKVKFRYADTGIIFYTFI